METLNPDQDVSLQVEDSPLSEGFHWESVPASPLATNSESPTVQSPQPPDATQTQPESNTQGASQVDGPPELLTDSKGVLVKEEEMEKTETKDNIKLSQEGKMKREAATVSWQKRKKRIIIGLHEFNSMASPTA